MPISDEEKTRISNAVSVEALRAEHEEITRQIQLEGLPRGRESALLSELWRITEERMRQLLGRDENSSKVNEFIAQTPTPRGSFVEPACEYVSFRHFQGFNELIRGESDSMALQLYHPTTSELHSDADRRILRLKDGRERELQLYADALLEILPSEGIIYLSCIPPSSPYGSQSLKNLIARVTRASERYRDASSLFRTIVRRGKKSHGSRFTDEELASTIAVEPFVFDPMGTILLIDDVVTSGQSFRVCKTMLREVGVLNSILCLAMAKTDRYSSQQGIVDRLILERSTIDENVQAVNTSQQHRPPRVSNRYRSDSVARTTPKVSSNQIKTRPSPTGNSNKQKVSASNSDCFVVTAIYDGDCDHKDVQLLRRWRDEKLASTVAGKRLILLYYKIGPYLASIVKSLRLSRVLRPMLKSIAHKLYD
jgi:hypothetical protein